MTTIIRIEHPFDGKGLWNSKNQDGYRRYNDLSCCGNLVAKHYYFPTPSSFGETLGDIYSDEFCSFKTIEQLQEWIEPSWMEEIIDMGFKILMLDVSECRIGKYQVLFKKENVVQTKDITSLFQKH